MFSYECGLASAEPLRPVRHDMPRGELDLATPYPARPSPWPQNQFRSLEPGHSAYGPAGYRREGVTVLDPHPFCLMWFSSAPRVDAANRTHYCE